jgi:fatty acid desaturase
LPAAQRHDVPDPREGRGEEFRDDLRGVTGRTDTARAARRLLAAEELAPLTRLDDWRSLASMTVTALWISAALVAAAAAWWGEASGTVLLAVALGAITVIGVQQHAMFILAHEAAHYRLFANRRLNDAVGRLIGMAGGISMRTYRVVHRLHHNHLYDARDPDTAIHGGYPRGVSYLWKKLAQDLLGLNAWKTFAYFFGAPALNDDTGTAARPLDDTAPRLRAEARADRWGVVAFQLGVPVACGLIGGWELLGFYLLFWVVPLVTVLQPILRLRAICEHGAVTDLGSPLTAARTNLTGWGGTSRSGRRLDAALNLLGRLVLFPHHVNHHLEHHLYPAVPHYHLPALHGCLVRKGVLVDGEVRDLRQTLALVFDARRPHAARTASEHPATSAR